MRKGSGGGGAGLYSAGLIHHPHLNSPHHHQGHPLQHPLNPHLPLGMVQQARSQAGGGNGGRIFMSSHHPQQASGAGPYAALHQHQQGILLHHAHHPVAAPQPHHHAPPPQHQLHRAPPIVPAQFQNLHHPHQFGTGLPSTVTSSLVNSHFGSAGVHQGGGGSGSLGGSGGGGSGSGGSSHGVPSCGGDLPPVETVVARLETACRLLHGIGGNNTRVAEISSEIQILSEDLRRVGAMLENTYPEVLDRVMSSMRDASAQPCLPPSLRLAIFELVELRASKWMLPSDSSNYYRQRRNLNEAATTDVLLEERSGRSSSGGGTPSTTSTNNVSVVVTNCTGGTGVASNPVKPEVIFQGGSTSPASTVETPPPPAKTYREEIVIKNSDSGKVAPTAKERVLSINGYSQQSINLAKQLIQETITRNASPVLEGMVLPSSSADFPDLASLEEAELGLKRLQLQSSSTPTTSSNSPHANKLDPNQHPHHGHHSSHFSYTVTLGDHSIRILGDDLQYVQEAKMALDDYFLQKYPDLFCASNSIEDVEEEEEEEEDFQEDEEAEEEEEGCFSPQRYDRETLLSLAVVRTPPPDFSHLDPDIRGNIVLDKRREFDVEKFSRETTSSTSSQTAASVTTNNQNHGSNAANNNINNNKASADSVPG